MEIRRFISPLLNQNMYVLEDNGHSIIIDPYFDERSCALLQNSTLDFMLVTHEHYDHISGVNAFKAKYDVPLYANEKANCNMQKPTKNCAKFYEAYLKIQRGVILEKLPSVDAAYVCKADILWKDKHVMTWQGHRFFFKMVPGHSDGSSLIIVDDTIVFSGDCMLAEDIPVTRFPGGNRRDFEDITLPYLRVMDKNLVVYPGHEDSFRLGEHYLLQTGEDAQ